MYMYIMTTRKIKRNMVGGASGAGLIRGTSLIKNPDTINQDFASLFKYYLSTNHIKKDNFLPVNDDDVDIIYIGLKENENIFGDIIKQLSGGLIIQIKFRDLLHIKNTTENMNLINQFKLHLMSIMANDALKGHKLLIELNDPIKQLDYTAIMKLLEIKEDVKASVVAPPPPPLQNDDMLELMIYKEFGVNCPPQIGGGKFSGVCINKYDSLYYNKLSLNYKPLTGINYEKLPNYTKSLIRDIYVNLFNVITGISAGQSKCLLIYNGFKFIKQITPNTFYGFITKKPFKFKDIIKHVNIIRERIDRHYCGLNGITYEDYINQNESNLLKNEAEWP